MDSVAERKRGRDARPAPSPLKQRPRATRELSALKQEARRIEQEIRKHEKQTQDHPTSGNHMAEDAGEVFEEAKDIALVRHLEKMLDQVRAAIVRLEKGTYGICEVCGGEIGEERLQAIPYAATCVHCARSAQNGARAA